MPVQEVNQIEPSAPRTTSHQRAIQFHSAEASHVDHESVLGDTMSAHGVLSSAHTDLCTRPSGKFEGRHNIFLVPGKEDALNLNGPYAYDRILVLLVALRVLCVNDLVFFFSYEAANDPAARYA